MKHLRPLIKASVERSNSSMWMAHEQKQVKSKPYHLCQWSRSHWIWCNLWWSLFPGALLFHGCELLSVLSHDALWEWQLGAWMSQREMHGGVFLSPWAYYPHRGKHQAGAVCCGMAVDDLYFLPIHLTLHMVNYDIFSPFLCTHCRGSVWLRFLNPSLKAGHCLCGLGPLRKLGQMVSKTHWFSGFPYQHLWLSDFWVSYWLIGHHILWCR